MPAREPGSSKGPRRSKSAHAGTSSARQEHTGRVKARAVRRLHKLHQRWHGSCAPGAQAELSRLGVCIHNGCSTSRALTASRLSLSVENYQNGGQRSARGEVDLKVRWQECGRISGMVFQAPRQPVALQQANLRNRTRVAAAIRIGQRSGDRLRRLG